MNNGVRMKQLNVLNISDSISDVDCVEMELRKAWPILRARRVNHAIDLIRELNKGGWNCILCDLTMVNFTVDTVLKIIQHSNFDIPFFVMYTADNSVEAFTAMDKGAHDAIEKKSLARLIPALRRELKTADVRRKKALNEDKVLNRAEKQQAITDIGLLALKGGGASELMGKMIAATCQSLSMAFGYILEFQPENDAFFFRAGLGWREPVAGTMCFDHGNQSMFDYMLNTNEALIITDLSTETRFEPSRLLIDQKIISGISVIIGDQAKPFGMLGAFSDTKQNFNEYDITYFTAMAQILALALKRVAAKKVTQKSEQRFRDFAISAADRFWETDENHKYTFVTPRPSDDITLPDHLLIGKPRWEMKGASANKKIWKDHIADLNAGRPFQNFRYTLEDELGRTHHLKTSGIPIFNEAGLFSGYRGSTIDETVEYEFKKSRRENDKRYRSIINSARDAIISTTENGKITQFNPAAEKMFGIECDDAMGEKVDDLLIPDEKIRAHQAAFKKYFKNKKSILNGVEPLTTIARRANGERFPVELTVSRFDSPHKTCTAMIRDVSKRIAYEEKIQVLSHAIEQGPAAVIITNANGSIEYVNARFTELTGYLSAEICGQNPRILKSGKTPQEIYIRLWEQLGNGNSWRGTFHNKKKNGDTYLAGASISPIVSDDGTVTHFIGIQQDITQRIEDDKRLKHSEKMDALGNLAGGVAHDFNNMLLPILALTTRVRDGLAEGDTNRTRLDKVVQAADRAKDLVARILTFSRWDEVVRQNINIGQVIGETIGLLKSTIPATIKINAKIDLDASIVFAAPVQIQTVLLNLASNSADAIAGQTGEFTLVATKVNGHDVVLNNQSSPLFDQYIKISVSDTGSGMAEKTLNRIFDPFFTTKSVGEGTGLGLAAVYGIVTALDGVIDVKSDVGVGSKFDIYLPRVNEIIKKTENRTHKTSSFLDA